MNEPIIVNGGTPAIVMTRIASVETVEVVRSELEMLEASLADENQALAFLTFAAGIFIGAGLQWVCMESTTEVQKIVLGVTEGVSGLSTAWFSLTWWRKSKAKTTLLNRVLRKN